MLWFRIDLVLMLMSLVLPGLIRPGSSLLLAKNDKKFGIKIYSLIQSLQYLAERWTWLATTILTHMLPWRLPRDFKRWSVVQHIFVSFAAMVTVALIYSSSFFQWGA